MKLTSTPSSPTTIRRDVGTLSFRLTPEGLTIGEALGPDALRFELDEALALRDFLRSPGVSALLGRAWLAQQHAAELEAEAADDGETRHKLHAGARKAA